MEKIHINKSSNIEKKHINLSELTTELENPISTDIDSKSSLDIIKIINSEDKKVAFAVEKSLPSIALLIDDVVKAFKHNGRLIYIGAGTSGRLGVLDAAECPPTYGTAPSMVQGLIAGGHEALVRSVEEVEDKAELGVQDLKNIGFAANDVLVGITASGQAPYVLGAMGYAKELGSVVGAISCNKNSDTFQLASHRIFIDVGPEVITGSTRMKAGTAQKLVLNMITTASMIRMGKVYKNLMIDLQPVNKKLVERSINLVMKAASCTRADAEAAFAASGKKPKLAILMLLLNIDAATAARLANDHEGHIIRAIEAFSKVHAKL